jgi:endonuclease YncB( thermonuclease family)
MFRLALTAVVVAFLIAAGVRVADVFVELPWEGCETRLCCPDCDEVDVVRVIDGDTLVSKVGRIRFFGMDTPEVGQRCAREATELTRDLAGDTVRVEPGPRRQDLYGRYLFYVYTGAGDSIDEILVREGLARAWTQDGQHREYLVSVETESRDRGVGCLW